LIGPFLAVPEVLHFYTVSATARQNYRPSVHYDPRNAGKPPMRTWRLIYEHLDLVLHSDLTVQQKAYLVGSVLKRFAIRDFRRLAAETYHIGRFLATRPNGRSIGPIR
jgi:hydroxyacyl-ACP dehydratase HTD2-like protein with hotdog domain